MKQLFSGFLSIFLAVLIVALGFLVYANFDNFKDEKKAEEVENATAKPVVIPEDGRQQEEGTVPEPEGENYVDFKLAVCGDLVCHEGINAEAKQSDGSYNYETIMKAVSTKVNEADYAMVTMETSFQDNKTFSGYPMFKSPDSLATSLKNTGFDLVNTASNHCMDGLENGLYRTLDVLDQNGLDHVGTYRSQEERDANNGILVKEINGVSVAFVSYTYGTNAIPVTGFDYAVNLLFTDYLDNNMHTIDYDSLRADMAAARALNTDLIIAVMHWGIEYMTTPVDYQREVADFLFAEGADLVLGGHVHVPEPMELRKVTDNEGNEKNGFIVYCMGNFISCQNDRYTNLTAVLNLTLRKDLDTGKTYLKHVSYDPMIMIDLADYGLQSDWRYRLLDLHGAIGAYESGDNWGVINQTIYDAMIVARDDLHSIFGAEFDSANGGVDVVEWGRQNQG